MNLKQRIKQELKQHPEIIERSTPIKEDIPIKINEITGKYYVTETFRSFRFTDLQLGYSDIIRNVHGSNLYHIVNFDPDKPKHKTTYISLEAALTYLRFLKLHNGA